MKIAITCYPTYGGSGVIASELGKKLADRGHQIHFISYALPFRLDKFRGDIYFHEVEMVDYPLFYQPPYTLALAAKMAEVARAYELDILHVHYAIPHAVSAFLARQMLSCPLPKLVTTLHGTDITLVGSQPTFLDITRLGLTASDVITSVSRFLAEQTCSVFQLEREIAVIHNFVDTSVFLPGGEPGLKAKFSPHGEKLLMHISNFRPLKRVGDVIRVFARLSRSLPARLIMVGEGQDLPLAKELAAQQGVSDKVVFLSQQRQVESLLSLADLFLITSELESFGLAALEAMSCGVPVIGTRCGGLEEVVEDNLCGLLSPVGDVAQMANNCEKLLADPALHRQFRTAARELALRRYDSGMIVPLYEECYRKSLAEGTQP